MGFCLFFIKTDYFFQVIYLTGKEYQPSPNMLLRSIRYSDVMAKKEESQTGMPEGS